MKKTAELVAVPFRVMAGFVAVSIFWSQTAWAAGAQAAAVPGVGPGQITVPAATTVPLTLVSPIKSKSTKVGDAVRAQVAFPITVGAQVAIPAGTYVEGVVTSLTEQGKQTRQPDVQIHFTRLVYANGYTVTLDAANTQARNEVPDLLPPGVGSGVSGFGAGRTRIAFSGGEGFTSRAQTSDPTTPTLPQVGPSKALVFGITGGVLAAALTLGMVFKHRGGNADYVLFDAGWQFQMAISSPLTLDGAQVAAAAATPH
jgi:hypothetical protein